MSFPLSNYIHLLLFKSRHRLLCLAVSCEVPEGDYGSYSAWWLCPSPRGLSLALDLMIRGRHVWGEAGRDRAGIGMDRDDSLACIHSLAALRKCWSWQKFEAAPKCIWCYMLVCGHLVSLHSLPALGSVGLEQGMNIGSQPRHGAYVQSHFKKQL